MVMIGPRRQRLRRRQWPARIVCLVALAPAAWVALAWGAARALEVRAGIGPAVDALYVFSGGRAYVERTRVAAYLYRTGLAPIIVLSDDDVPGGWSQAEQRNPFFVERAAAELRRAGVPAERIEVLPRKVSGTYDEALLLREYAAARNLRSISAVTSDYHSRRALWALRRVFRGSGIRVDIAATASDERSPAPLTWWSRRDGWRTIAGEYLGLAYYWAQYR